MKVKHKTVTDKLSTTLESVKELKGRKVNVGVLEGEHAWLAAIHEYGCTIRPQKAQYLTVPVTHEAKGKKAGDFSDLFVFKARSGELYLGKTDGNGKLKAYFWLTKEVKIPERSFLRKGYDENIDTVLKMTKKLEADVTDGTLSVEQFLKQVGLWLSSAIKDYARDLKDPPNSRTTIRVKGSSNPLWDTGEMIRGITYEVE